MRLIDADAFLKRNEVYADCEFIHPMYQNTLREIVDDEPTIPAPRWHRVEEEPKESGKQYVVWASKGYAYCDKWLGDRWLISSVAPETVTYWMPIEPPGEDA